jgi:hypothetical protein
MCVRRPVNNALMWTPGCEVSTGCPFGLTARSWFCDGSVFPAGPNELSPECPTCRAGFEPRDGVPDTAPGDHKPATFARSAAAGGALRAQATRRPHPLRYQAAFYIHAYLDDKKPIYRVGVSITARIQYLPSSSVSMPCVSRSKPGKRRPNSSIATMSLTTGLAESPSRSPGMLIGMPGG